MALEETFLKSLLQKLQSSMDLNLATQKFTLESFTASVLQSRRTWRALFRSMSITNYGYQCSNGSELRTFAPKSSYGEIFFISPIELVHKVLTPKMKKKMRVTDFVPEKMAVEKCLNFDKSVIITRCSLLC